MAFDAPTFLLASLAIVFGVTWLLAFLANHCGTASTPPSSLGRTFFYSIISMAIIYQFHLLLEVSVRFPSGGKHSNAKSMFRWQCLNSRKGGKRPYGDTGIDFQNPCYNRTAEIENNNETEVESFGQPLLSINNGYFPSPLCSSTSDEEALTNEPYISDARDCHQAQSGRCTRTDPCVPCELSRRDEFHSSQHGWSRCQACSIRNRFGDCNFKDGVGPYCYKDSHSWEVVPCQKCCTEGTAMVGDDGICY